ncbi:MAG: chloride channel protein [Alphaproteobacteria bacterium]|jgi:CIC family chloride channel protein|nr:chloride channel protein [Alphaproteobacteria bacterium]MDP6516882.1 chloride channel protein [Alphaproteobacteria bacterium]
MAASNPHPRRATKLWRRLIGNDQLVLFVLAAVVGVAAAYGAIGFRIAIDAIQTLFYGARSEEVIATAQALAWWHRLLAPALGGLGIGLFVHFVMPARRNLGVAEVIEAGVLKGGRMRLRDGFTAAAASAASIGVGASVGREGPVVHLVATMGSWLAQRLRLGRSMTLTLLGCAVASGVAASFNAPIAGVFFALEVVVGHYGLSAFAPVVIAGVLGTIVVRIHLGDFPAFVVPGAEITSFTELPAFLLLGGVCAVMAILLMAGITLVATVAERTRLPGYLVPAGGGLLVGAVAVFFPEVIGVGYETTDRALGGGLGLWVLLLLLAAKTAASCLSLGSGFGGGIFSPALCIGALTGAAFGTIAVALAPALGANVSAYSIVGMGAVAGAVLGAPISTILIIFELTGDYTLTLAVMAAGAVSSLIVRQTVGNSFFTLQLARRGVDLAGGHERAVCQAIPASQLVSDRYRTVEAAMPVEEIRELLRRIPDTELYVVDAAGRLVGLLAFNDIKEAVFGPDMDPALRAGDLASLATTLIAQGETLDRALELFETTDSQYLPVVETLDSAKLVGVIRHRDALMAYNQALSDLNRERGGAR